MPELPDLTVYVEHLQALLVGQVLEDVELPGPFLLRTVEPAPATLRGQRVVEVSRLGKRIVLAFDAGCFAVIHLMIAGRLRWRAAGTRVSGARPQALLRFAHGTLLLTEAGSHRRASLHLLRGRDSLADFDRGGLEVPGSHVEAFAAAMRERNHTLKRALTDPGVLSGIGNAYSDEILHRARLSPFRQTRHLDEEEMGRLHSCTCAVLAEWTARLRTLNAGRFPDKVTAFREGMAVHGRYRQPCPVCASPVQRIVYAGHEANYCARCQTGGRLLADRALSRLLKSNWPRTLEELEAHDAAVGAERPGGDSPARRRLR